MIGSTPKLFICYRREETAAHAGRLYDAVAARFGERNVFMDIELEPGIDFVDRIGEVVGACHVFLVVVGPTWATLSNGGNRPRIADAEDFVRLEVETALRRREVRVIPLLVGGARMPHSEDLPEELRTLTRRNALELSDLRWRYDIGRLMGTLEDVLGPVTMATPAGAEAAAQRPQVSAPVEPVEPAPPTPADAPVTEPPERREPPAPAPPTERPRPSRRRWILGATGAAAAVLLLAGLAIAGVFGGGDEGDGGDGGGKGGSPRVSETIPVGSGPDGLAVDGDVLWVTDQVENRVRRVDVETNELIGEPIPVGQNPDGVAAEGGTAWVASIDDGTVTRLNTGDDGTVAEAGTVNLDGHPEGIALGKQLVWVTTGTQGNVRRIDRAQATPLNPPIPVGRNTIDVLIGTHDRVFVSDKFDNTVTRIDSATTKRLGEPTRVGNRPRGLAEAAGSVWVTNSRDDTVSRIDASNGRLVGDTINVGDNPRDITAAGGFVWVVNTDSGTVTRIDARKGTVAGKPIRVGQKPASIEAGAGSVWVSNSGDGTVSRIEP